MDLGTGITLSTLCISCGGIIIKWISVLPKQTSKNNENNGNGTSSKTDNCPLHAGLEERLKAGDRTMQELKAESAATIKTVIRIASHMNISVADIEKELGGLMR